MIKRKKAYKNCLEATQLEDRINCLEKKLTEIVFLLQKENIKN